MLRHIQRILIPLLFCCPVCTVSSQEITDVDEVKANPDVVIEGEYLGDAYDEGKIGARVTAQGKGKFRVVVYQGGLPGAGWKTGDLQTTLQGTAVELKGRASYSDTELLGKIVDGQLLLKKPSWSSSLVLTRVERDNPTQDAKLPGETGASAPRRPETGPERGTFLFIRTRPDGAKVLIDGKQVGVSDDLFPVDPGVRRIVVELEGHDPDGRDVTVRAGRIERVKLVLTKRSNAPAGTPGGPVSPEEDSPPTSPRDDTTPWGEQVEGIQCRLRAERVTWDVAELGRSGLSREDARIREQLDKAIHDHQQQQEKLDEASRLRLEGIISELQEALQTSGRPFGLKLDIRSRSKRTWYAMPPAGSLNVEWDGEWFRAEFLGETQPWAIRPGDTLFDRPVHLGRIVANPDGPAQETSQIKAIPGWHTIRLAVSLSLDERKISVVSNSVKIRIVRGEAAGEAVGPPQAQPGEPKKVFLRNADDPAGPAILDLASGNVLTCKSEAEVEQLARQGKGDVFVYQGHLGCLRGAQPKWFTGVRYVELPVSEQDEHAVLHKLLAVPCRLRITTADGNMFDLTVSSTSAKGTEVEYHWAGKTTPPEVRPPQATRILGPGEYRLVQVDRQEHDRQIYSVAFSPGHGILAVGDFDGKVRIISTASRQVDAELDPFEEGQERHPAFALAWSPDGNTLAVGVGGRVILYDEDTGGPKLALHDPQMEKRLGEGMPAERARKLFAVPHAHADIASIAFSPDGKTLATGGGKGELAANSPSGEPRRGMLKLWDVETGSLKKDLVGHSWDVFSVAFSPDGRTLASVSRDGTIRLWDPETGREKQMLRTPGEGMAYSIAFSPAGKHLISSGGRLGAEPNEDYGHLLVWNARTGVVEFDYRHAGQPTSSVVFPPDGHTVAVVSGNRLLLWNPLPGKTVQTIVAEGKGVMLSCVALAPDGNVLAVGGWDKAGRGSLAFWRLDAPADTEPGRSAEQHPHRDSAAQLVGKSSEKQLSFGPVIEKRLLDRRSAKDCYIDFDTGRLFGKPRPRDKSVGRIDAGASLEGDSSALLSLGMLVFPAAENLWEDGSPKEVLDTIESSRPGKPVMSVQDASTQTFLFKTPEGAVGILQVLGLTGDEPQRIQIRYKLVRKTPAEADVQTARAQIKNLQVALARYFLDVGAFPASKAGLKSLVFASEDVSHGQRWKGPYVKPPVPTDPWGNPYQYRFPGKTDSLSFDLWSAGPDGKSDTDDDVRVSDDK